MWPPQQQPPPHNPLAAPPPAPQAHHHVILVHQQPQPQPPPAYYYPNHNPSPNPSYIPNLATVADPYAPHGGYSAGYYYASSSGAEAIQQYVIQPVTYGAPVVPLRPPNGLNPTAPHQSLPGRDGLDINYERGLKKGSHMSKMAQSAYCGVCKIECNSREVLNSHKQGKKHKKNLQKLQEAITPRPKKAQVAVKLIDTEAPVAKGNALGTKKTKRKDAPEEDLETKKRRIVEEGTDPNEVKVCTICNVVMNSQIVYNFHIAGSKHAAMVKKQQEAAAS